MSLNSSLDELDKKSRDAATAPTGLENRTAELEAGLDQLDARTTPTAADAAAQGLGVTQPSAIPALDLATPEMALQTPDAQAFGSAVAADTLIDPAPRAQAPEHSWDEITASPSWAEMKPEEQVQILHGYAQETREYLRGQGDVDPNEVDDAMKSFVAEQTGPIRSAAYKGLATDLVKQRDGGSGITDRAGRWFDREFWRQTNADGDADYAAYKKVMDAPESGGLDRAMAMVRLLGADIGSFGRVLRAHTKETAQEDERGEQVRDIIGGLNEDRAAAAILRAEELRDAKRANPDFRITGGTKGVFNVERLKGAMSLAEAEDLRDDLTRPGLEGAGRVALGKFAASLPFLKTDQITIDENDQEQVAQRAALKELLDEAVEKKFRTLALVSGTMGSVAGFAMSGGAAGALMKGSRAAKIGGTIGYAAEENLKNDERSLGAVDRLLSIAADAGGVVLSEGLGSRLQSRFTALTQRQALRSLPKPLVQGGTFAAEAVGAGIGETASSLFDRAMAGQDVFDGFGETLFTSFLPGTGFAAASAITNRQSVRAVVSAIDAIRNDQTATPDEKAAAETGLLNAMTHNPQQAEVLAQAINTSRIIEPVIAAAKESAERAAKLQAEGMEMSAKAEREATQQSFQQALEELKALQVPSTSPEANPLDATIDKSQQVATTAELAQEEGGTARAPFEVVGRSHSSQTEGEQIISSAIRSEDGSRVATGAKWNSPHAEITLNNAVRNGIIPDSAEQYGFIAQDGEGNQRFVTRAEAFEIAKKSGQAADGANENFQSQDLKEVTKAPAAPPAPTAEKIDSADLPSGDVAVTIERPDGTRYQAAFGGKFWELGDEKKPSIARLTADGKWSHGLLAEGERIVEAPAQFQDVVQPAPATTKGGEKDGDSQTGQRNDQAEAVVEAPAAAPAEPTHGLTRGSAAVVRSPYMGEEYEAVYKGRRNGEAVIDRDGVEFTVPHEWLSKPVEKTEQDFQQAQSISADNAVVGAAADAVVPAARSEKASPSAENAATTEPTTPVKGREKKSADRPATTTASESRDEKRTGLVEPKKAAPAPKEIRSSDKTHEQTTVAGIAELVRPASAEAQAALKEEIGKRYAVVTKLLNQFGLKNDETFMNVDGRTVTPLDLLRDDMVDNIATTGDPFKTKNSKGEVVPYAVAGKGGRGRISSKLIDFVKLKENKLRTEMESEGSEGETRSVLDDPSKFDTTSGLVQELTRPSEAAIRNETPVEDEDKMNQSVSQAIARQISAFAKAGDLPLKAAPKATEAQITRAARLVLDDVLLSAAGAPGLIDIGVEKRGKKGPAEKLRVDPAFRKAVEDRVLQGIRDDLAPMIADLRERNRRVTSPMVEALLFTDEELKTRIADLRKAYEPGKGINHVMAKIASSADNTAEGRMQKLLAQTLAKVGANSRVVLSGMMARKQTTAGDYNPASTNIRLSPWQSEKKFRWVAIHEKIHAVVFDKVEAFRSGDHSLLTAQDLATLNEIEALRQVALSQPNVPQDIRDAAAKEDMVERQNAFQKAVDDGSASAEHYGLIDLHEFTAEALTNESFQDFLNSIQAEAAATESNATVWARIKAAFRQLVLGGTPVKEGSLLAKAFDMSLDVVRTGSLADQQARNAIATSESAMRLDAQRQTEFLKDFARENGYTDMNEMVVRDPQLFTEAAELWRAVSDEAPALMSPLFAEEPRVQRETERRAAQLYNAIDALVPINSAEVIRQAQSNGARSAEEFADALLKAGLNPAAAAAAGRAMESHARLAVLDAKPTRQFLDRVESDDRYDEGMRRDVQADNSYFERSHKLAQNEGEAYFRQAGPEAATRAILARVTGLRGDAALKAALTAMHHWNEAIVSAEASGDLAAESTARDFLTQLALAEGASLTETAQTLSAARDTRVTPAGAVIRYAAEVVQKRKAAMTPKQKADAMKIRAKVKEARKEAAEAAAKQVGHDMAKKLGLAGLTNPDQGVFEFIEQIKNFNPQSALPVTEKIKVAVSDAIAKQVIKAMEETVPKAALDILAREVQKQARDQVNTILRGMTEVVKKGDAERIANAIDKLSLAEATFNMAVSKMHSKGLDLTDARFDRSKIDGLSSYVRQSVDFSEVLTMGLIERSASVETLKAKLLAEVPGLTNEQATTLAAAAEVEFNKNVLIATKNRLKGLLTEKKPARKGLPSAAQKVLDATKLGVFSDEVLYNAVAENFGLPTFDPDVAAQIMERAESIQQMLSEGREGFQTDRATEKLLNYIRDAHGVDKADVIIAVTLSNMLSGPVTQLKNITSNLTQGTAEIATMQMARTNPVTAILTSGKLLAAYGNGMGEGWNEFMQIMRTGQGGRKSIDGGTDDKSVTRSADKIEGVSRVLERNPFGKLDLKRPKTYGFFLNNWKYVSRFMSATDMVFYRGAKEARAWMMADSVARAEGLKDEKAISRRVAEILHNTEAERAKATIRAAKEGLSGRDFTLRVAELIEQARPDDIQIQSGDFARRATFNYKPEGLVGALADTIHALTLSDKIGAGGRTMLKTTVVPFVNVVGNVLNATIDWTPFGVRRAFSQKWNTKNHGELRRQQLIKNALGTAAVTALVLLSKANDDEEEPAFRLHGSGPSDPAQRKQLQETGWSPYSIQVGGTYISYQYLPIAAGLSVAANYLDADRYMGRGPRAKDGATTLDSLGMDAKLAFVAGNSAKVITSMSFMSGVNDLAAIVQTEDPGSASKAVSNWAARAARSYAVPNLLVQGDKFLRNDTVYQPQTLVETLMRDIPVVRERLKPALNVLGEPIHRSPLKAMVSTRSGHPVFKMLAEKQLGITMPTLATKLGDRSMTPPELHEYVKRSGAEIKTWLEQPAVLARINALDRERAQKFIDNKVEAIRTRTKAKLRREAVVAGTL